MTRENNQEVVEWVGGLASMPAYVTGEGNPYRPELLLWLGPKGVVLGSSLSKPGESIRLAAASLESTIARPDHGDAHSPTRVRVASPDLAESLRASHPTIQIVCAPTPEIDGLVASMRERMRGEIDAEPSHLAMGVDPAAMASFFRAAAALFRAQPWKVVPTDSALFSLSIESMGVRDAALTVVGQLGESLGVIVFRNWADWDAYGRVAVRARDETPTVPPHFCLNFSHENEVATSLRTEIAQQGWEVAGPDAYPSIRIVDGDLVSRPPTAEEVTIAEAIALALPQILADKKMLFNAWNHGVPVARALSVSTHAGEHQVSLRVPYPERAPSAPTFETMAGMLALDTTGPSLPSPERARLRDELINELMHQFVTSPEAEALDGAQYCFLVMKTAATYLDATIATMGPTEIGSVVFDIIPRVTTVPASEARKLIDQNRALYKFLERAFHLPQADVCFRRLGGPSVKRLVAALEDPDRHVLLRSRLIGVKEETAAATKAEPSSNKSRSRKKATAPRPRKKDK